MLTVYTMAHVCIEKCLCTESVLLTIFRLKIIMPVERIEIFLILSFNVTVESEFSFLSYFAVIAVRNNPL